MAARDFWSRARRCRAATASRAICRGWPVAISVTPLTTEHWIRRRPAARQVVVAALPDDSGPSTLPHGFWGNEDEGQVGSAVMSAPAYWTKRELLQQGIRLLERSLADHPEHSERRFHLGMGYVQSHQWTQAELALQAVLRREPDHSVARQLLGRVYVQLQQPVRALACFEEAVRRNPHFAGAAEEMATLYFRVNRPARLLEMLDTTMRDHPRLSVVLGLAASAQLTIGSNPRASRARRPLPPSRPPNRGARRLPTSSRDRSWKRLGQTSHGEPPAIRVRLRRAHRLWSDRGGVQDDLRL